VLVVYFGKNEEEKGFKDFKELALEIEEGVTFT